MNVKEKVDRHRAQASFIAGTFASSSGHTVSNGHVHCGASAIGEVRKAARLVPYSRVSGTLERVRSINGLLESNQFGSEGKSEFTKFPEPMGGTCLGHRLGRAAFPKDFE